jgi:tripartite-type tricarboxylate transporter receptor subunit TctC
MKKKRLILIVIAAVLLTAAAVVYFFWADFFGKSIDIPENIVITVAWNPGSIADDMVRVMHFGDTQLVLQNIVGTHGAQALNAVYAAPHDGINLLSTSLSAFYEVYEMGFVEGSPDDWTWWIVAYSPEHEDYYGLFVPAGVPESRLNGLEKLIEAATSTDEFVTFLGFMGLMGVDNNVDFFVFSDIIT